MKIDSPSRNHPRGKNCLEKTVNSRRSPLFFIGGFKSLSEALFFPSRHSRIELPYTEVVHNTRSALRVLYLAAITFRRSHRVEGCQLEKIL